MRPLEIDVFAVGIKLDGFGPPRLARRVNVPVDSLDFWLKLDVAVTPRLNALASDCEAPPMVRLATPDTARRTSDNFDSDCFDCTPLVDAFNRADGAESVFGLPRLGRRPVAASGGGARAV